MKYVVVFAVLSLILAFEAWQSQNYLLKWFFASGALCFGVDALAYFTRNPRLFLKNPRGHLTALSWLVFWPLHLLNSLSLAWFRRRETRRGELYSRINEKIWLGPRLGEIEAAALMKREGFAVLDVTAEISESRAFRRAPHYLNLPVLDKYAPTQNQLKTGVDWMTARRYEGPIYVHCALGHGRSATFVAAFLLASGDCVSIDRAIEKIKLARPGIDISAAQQNVLRQFEREFL